MSSWIGALLGEPLAERGPRHRALAHQLQRPLGAADRAHAVVDPAGPEAGLGDHEATALLADQVELTGTRTSVKVISQWPSWC